MASLDDKADDRCTQKAKDNHEEESKIEKEKTPVERQGKIVIDGFELLYRMVGKGTPVLVVGSAVYYPRLFSPALSEQVQLIFIDHRGFAKAPDS